jgi:hypothetical protein
MRLRLMGTRDEIAEWIEVLSEVLVVEEQSGFYLNRGSTVRGRVYIEVALRPTIRRATAERTDQPPPTGNPELPAGRQRRKRLD